MVAWAFPLDPQASDGSRHAVGRNIYLMLGAEIIDEQRGGPDRRTITELARVNVDNFFDEGINDPFSRARAATSRSIGKARSKFNAPAPLKSESPVVNALTGDA
jgi:hypothetical protein